MADIFFSYARVDKARVAPIVQLLTAQGCAVWWDPAILPGDAYRNLIDAELMAAKCVVVAWSDTSVTSDWVRDEAEKGKAANKLIPIFLDTVEQPLGFRQIHALNFVGWNYKPDHPSAGKLLAAVRRKVDLPSPQNISSPSLSTPGVAEAPTQTTSNLPDVILGLAIDTSGSMEESIRNDTGRIMYQFKVSGVNTCGLCWQYDGAISTWWSKQHRGCACEAIAVYPTQETAPYVDWRKKFADLPEDQKETAVGVSNWKLIESGTVKWDDVVTPHRVRNLREVVSREKLTVEQMTNAGVRPQDAHKAYATVHTPAHELAAQHQLELTKRILDLGVQPQHLREIFGEQMAQRVGIARKPTEIEWVGPGKTDAQWVAILQRSLGEKIAMRAQIIEKARRLREQAAREEAARVERERLAAEEAERARQKAEDARQAEEEAD